MNLIQQAVERADQMERGNKMVSTPLPLAGPLHGVQSRSFRPTPMNPSRVPPAALGLAVLAVVGGALLYAALVRTQGGFNGSNAAVHKLAPTIPMALLTTAAKSTPAPVADAAAVPTAAPVASARPVTVLAAEPDVASTRELDDARATIESWALAWSERDVSGYLAHYGNGFTPNRGATRAAWEKSRRQMIERRHNITVNIAELRLEKVSDSRIIARYVQDYAADAYRETGTPKRLVLERESRGWRIVGETADTANAGSS